MRAVFVGYQSKERIGGEATYTFFDQTTQTKLKIRRKTVKKRSENPTAVYINKLHCVLPTSALVA